MSNVSLEANEIRILSKDGATRMLLATSESGGSPYINLFDQSGTPRLYLSLDGASDETPHVTLLSSNGANLLSLNVAVVDGEELGALVITARSGNVQLEMSVSSDGVCNVIHVS